MSMSTFGRKSNGDLIFDYEDVLSLDFKEPALNNKAKLYSDTLKRLCISIKYKRSGKLTSSVILLCGNGQHHEVTFICLGLLLQSSIGGWST